MRRTCACFHRLLAIFWLAGLHMAPGSVHADVAEIELLIDTADTYFWFGVSERGNVEAFDKAAQYLERAKMALQADTTLAPARAHALKTRIQQARRDVAAQREVHHDTLYGVFPLARFFGASLFQSARATGSFELVDDPSVMAATWAAELMATVQETNMLQYHQLDTVIHSVPYDPALENEVFYVLQTRSDFFLYSKENLLRLVGEEEPLPDLQQPVFPPDLARRAVAALDTGALLVVTVVRKPSEPDDRFYVVDGDLYVAGAEEPVQHSSLYGFSRDRRDQMEPILLLHLFLALFAQAYAAATSFSVRGVAGASSAGAVIRFQVVTLLAFLLGRMIPWGLLPTLATLLPLPENLAILSFWWVVLVGVLLFAGPALPVRVLQNPRIKLVERLDPRINAIVVAAALGSSAFMITPALAYYREAAYPLLAAILAAGTGIARFTWLCLDRHVQEIPPSYTLFALTLAGLAGMAALSHSPNDLFIIAGFAWGIVLVQSWIYSRRFSARVLPRRKAAARLSDDFRLPGQQQVIDELEQVRAAGVSAMVCITAGAGRGKSHVGESFYERWPHHASRYLASCSKEDSATPYQAIFEALEIDLHGDSAAQDPANENLVDEGVSRVLDPINTWLGDQSGSLHLQRPGTVHAWLYGMFFKSGDRLGGTVTPVLLVIDNAQWLDSGSRQFLQFALAAAQRESRVFMVVMLANGSVDLPNVTVLDGIDQAWSSLSTEARGNILRDFLIEVERILPDSAQILVSARRWHQAAGSNGAGGGSGEGNIIQQARIEVKYWKDSEVLQRVEATGKADEDASRKWELGPHYQSPERIPSPPGKQALIRAKTDAQASLHTVIGMAACLGSQFNARIIAEAAGMDRIQCLLLLKSFERETALIHESPGGEGDFEFTTPGTFTDAQRLFGLDGDPDDCPSLTREYCERLADTLKLQDAQEVEWLRLRPLLLRYAGKRRGLDHVEACLQFARFNRRKFQFAEAREQLAIARGHLEELNRLDSDLALQLEAEEILILSEQAHMEEDRRMPAVECADRFDAIEARIRQATLRMTLAAATVRALFDASEFTRAAATARRLQAFATQQEAPFFVAEALYYQAACQRGASPADPDAVLAWLEQAVSLLEPLQEEDACKLLARVCHLEGDLLATRDPDGNRQRAESMLRRSISLRTPFNDRAGIARVHERLAQLALSGASPDFRVALEHLEQTHRIGTELHDALRIASAGIAIARLQLRAGQPGAALEALAEAMEEPHAASTTWFQALELLRRITQDGTSEDTLPVLVRALVTMQEQKVDCAGMDAGLRAFLTDWLRRADEDESGEITELLQWLTPEQEEEAGAADTA